MKISIEKPGSEDVIELLKFHLAEANRNSPPGTVHALQMAKLIGPDITFWTARNGAELLGFGPLKELGDGMGEVKSMRRDPAQLKRGVGAAILETIIEASRQRGLRVIYLETGNNASFFAAHRLYQRYGFDWCYAVADYPTIEFSRFMKLLL